MPFCPPKYGDKVLVFKDPWLPKVLNGSKVLEVRGRRLAPGRYYLGFLRNIWGHVEVGRATLCENAEQWQAAASQHCVESPNPPYKKTWLHPLSSVCRSTGYWPYIHPRGAIGIVVYRLPTDEKAPCSVKKNTNVCGRSKKTRH
jgi:hypothetical protein